MVNFYQMPPPPHLSHFIKYFWAVEGDGTAEYIHRSVAFTLSYIVFHYKGTFEEVRGDERFRYPHAHFQGQTQLSRVFSAKEAFGIFGVNFYPFITPLLFGVAAYEITDQVCDIRSLLGAQAAELEEKMMMAPDNSARIAIICAFLESRLLRQPAKDAAIQEAIKYVINTSQVESVARLAGKFNLSKRQFERKFKEYGGFSPKLFTRISRFHEAFSYCESKAKTLIEIAHYCGYFDQAHFNHDFKTFSGYLPTEILRIGKGK